MSYATRQRRSDAHELEPASSAYHLARIDAQLGSYALLNHIERAFDRFAARHRITHDEARFLLVSSGTAI